MTVESLLKDKTESRVLEFESSGGTKVDGGPRFGGIDFLLEFFTLLDRDLGLLLENPGEKVTSLS